MVDDSRRGGEIDTRMLMDRVERLETQVSENRALINRVLERLVRGDVLSEGDFIDFFDSDG